MKFYSVLDCQSLSICPPSLQHLAIRSFCEQQGGEVSFYTCEDPLSLPHGVLQTQLPEIESDGLCFFTSKQFVDQKSPDESGRLQSEFDFPFLEQLLKKWVVGFARENVLVSTANYSELQPWLWREGRE